MVRPARSAWICESMSPRHDGAAAEVDDGGARIPARWRMSASAPTAQNFSVADRDGLDDRRGVVEGDDLPLTSRIVSRRAPERRQGQSLPQRSARRSARDGSSSLASSESSRPLDRSSRRPVWRLFLQALYAGILVNTTSRFRIYKRYWEALGVDPGLLTIGRSGSSAEICRATAEPPPSTAC